MITTIPTSIFEEEKENLVRYFDKNIPGKEKKILSSSSELKQKNCRFTIKDDDLNKLCLKRDEFEKIAEYITKQLLNNKPTEPTVFKRKETGLPYSISYNPESEKVFILFKEHVLPPIHEKGEACNVTYIWNMDLQKVMAFRAGSKEQIPDDECKINSILAERSDLFVATKEIYNYSGPLKRKDVEGDIPKRGFILEYLSIGDLFDNCKNFDLNQLISICCDIAEALEVLHNTYGIVHRDLKPENILICQCPDTQRYRAKIADFGHSAFQGEIPKNGYGSTTYMPPEFKEGFSKSCRPIADFSADIWTLGVILLILAGDDKIWDDWDELWKNNVILSGKDFHKAKKKILNEIDTKVNNNIPEILRLINLCLRVEPSKRLTIKEVVQSLKDIQKSSNTSDLSDKKTELQLPGDSSQLVQTSNLEKNISSIILEQKTSSNQKFTITDENLKKLQMKREEFDKIVNHIDNSKSKKTAVFKRNKTRLPYTAAYSGESDKIFLFSKEYLGEGANCKVKVGYDVKAQTEVAIRTANEWAISPVENNLQSVLSGYKHLFVLADEIFSYQGPFGKYQDNILLKKIEIPKKAMILEKMQTSLDKINELLTLRNIVMISQAILKGLNILHDKFKIVHRDLKPANILIKRFDKKMRTIEEPKIADFGFAHYKNSYTQDWCDHCYIPPEMKLDRLHYDKKYYQSREVSEEVKMIISNMKFPNKADTPEDMWSFGVILLEMISPPETFKLWHKIFNHHWELDSQFSDDKKEIFKDIMELYDLSPSLEKEIVESLIDIINGCLVFDPKQRLTAKEALEKINEIINNIDRVSSESNKQKGEK